MGRKLQTIYEYFSDYSIKEIDEMIYNLELEEKEIILARYGNDLHNPEPTKNWNSETSKVFYGKLIPKMKRLLKKGIEIPTETVITEEKEEYIVTPKETTIETYNQTPTLLELITKEKTNREICETLNISEKQLYEELLTLKNKGIMNSRNYYSDGSIKYSKISTMHDLSCLKSSDQNRRIITDTYEDTLKFLVISDLHFGNELERIDLINRAYNYCSKNNINIILCGGDLIDGSFTQGNQKVADLYNQIEYFIENYPYDKNILTFSVAGDHDISVFKKISLDIIEMCNNYRHDIIIGGYNNSQIDLKNDYIHLYHHIDGGQIRKTNAPIILHGHSHKYTTELAGNSLNVTIPSLSDINTLMPTALEMEINFNNGYFEETIVRQIYFGSQDIILNESKYNLTKGRKLNYGTIYNTEPYKAKTLIKQRLSQVEKFNLKYGEEKS